MAPSSSPLPSGIFISYRRQETAYPAGWLYQRLRDHFGSEQIFKDVDNLDPGDDFHEKIDHAVASCAVLLALIGDEWLDVADASGARRLDDPQDFVRLEIEAALRRGVRVVPLLLNGARMPRAEALPDSLAGLARRHAVELTPERFEADTARLLGVLERSLAGTAAARPAQAEPEPARSTDPVPPAAAWPPPVAAPAPAPRRPPDDRTEPTVPLQGIPGRRTPSGLPIWVSVTLVVATLALVWANLPGPAGLVYAWKDEVETGWYSYRTWGDAFVWAPVIALAGALGSVWARPLLGLTFGASAYTLGSALMVLAGGLSTDQTLEWTVSAVATAVCVVVCLRVAAHPRPAGLLRIPAATLAVLVGAGVWLAADFVEMEDFTWMQVTEGSALARQLMLFVAAYPVLVHLGGARWRAAFLVAGGTTVVVAGLDLLPDAGDVGSTIVGLWVAAMLVWAAGVGLAGWANLVAGRAPAATA